MNDGQHKISNNKNQICTVLEEDCDGENLKHLFNECRIHPDYMIICDPSGNKLVTGHKGKAQVAIKTHGISAHGSAPLWI